jgi:predicted metalloprotease
MKWRETRESTNVTNRGGMGMGAIGGGGALIIAIIAMLFGVNPGDILNGGGAAPGTQQQGQPIAEDDSMQSFVAHILGDTEDTWTEIFQKMGKQYVDPKLNIFQGAVQSACGTASAAMGPFYCPEDQQVYIDLSFYDDLKNKFGATGDFAEAYVIAHEVGHHVQKLLGLSDEVANARAGASRTAANAMSVRVELQADCLAGVWAHSADTERHLIQAGDIDEALNAASSIGDDRLQQETQGRVVPESFTHGTSAQRSRWFKQGYTTGDLRQCDTFNATTL